MFVDPGGERRGRDGETVTRFQFRGRLGQRVAEIVEGDAVENDGERIGLVAKRGRRRRERAPAGRHFHSCTVSSSWCACPCGHASCCRNADSARAALRYGNRAEAGGRRVCGSGGRIIAPGGGLVVWRRAAWARYNVYTFVMSRMLAGAACHGYWKCAVSRISLKRGRKRLAGQRVGGLVMGAPGGAAG